MINSCLTLRSSAGAYYIAFSFGVMYLKQHTIAEEVTIEGVGLHSGDAARLTFRPAPEGHGAVFKRIDLPGEPSVSADLEHVVELQRSTTIQSGAARVQTVEHVLAALAGLQIDNVLLELSGGEPPAADGSAGPYVDLLQQVGAEEQLANREFYVIEEPIHYHDPQKSIDLVALEYEEFRLTVTVDYGAKVLGVQHAVLSRIEDFEREIAPCRTFCFWHELESLIKSGLIKGGSLDNAIVLVDQDVSPEELKKVGAFFNNPNFRVAEKGVLNNTELRFPNEPARHKLLDLLGDLSLIGAPLRGQVMALRPGHAANIAFARQIRSAIKQKQIVRKYQKENAGDFVFDVNAIQQILPHRYPFLLVDRVTHFTPTSIVGIKNVTINEPFFSGHFDGNPIMPGVLQLEAMAQVGGILLLNIIDDPKDHWVYLLAIDKARFKKPVVPGDQLVFRLELLNLKRNICKMFGRAFVEDTPVCEAELVASLIRRDVV